jgi:phosphoribosylaminoimidazolecarboxamide formyltransferase/IMP cyclohydrolase
VDPADYARVLDSIAKGEEAGLRLGLCAKAFRHTAFYDSMISRYLTKAAGESPFAETLTVGQRRVLSLRYGENPHQEGALYADPLGQPGIARAKLLWGKELSYNNLLDADGAWELVCDLPENACVIVKHGNPCGAATGCSLGDAYRLARASDSVSAFGGVAAFHGTISEDAALAMTEKGNFLEVVIGSKFEAEAVSIFKERSGWGRDVRLLEAPYPPSEPGLTVRSIRGGWVVQETDEDPGNEWRVVTRQAPTEDLLRALRFQWVVVQHVKSNAIVVGTDDRLLGVGAGQMNRVQSVRLALEQAGPAASGAVVASDAFFPFPDSVEAAADAGIVAIVEPGGSKKDEEVIAAADRLGIAMCFTGTRHFRH